jgi:TolA-binding protein
VENISEITAGWVDEWQSRSSTEKPEKEIREFISGSIEPGISKPSERSPKPVRKANLRMVSAFLTLSAAAVAGIFLVIRGLSPADPDKLFASSYKPFNVISTTVRGDDQKPRTDYDSAIEKYKDGDYEGAASLFASISMRDTSLISSRFFLGLAETARGNYTGAVTQLSAIASRPGDYKKDALWYLGLAYLKLSDTKEASACFSSLAQSPGFYHGKAERILRRLR